MKNTATINFPGCSLLFLITGYYKDNNTWHIIKALNIILVYLYDKCRSLNTFSSYQS